MAFQQNTDGLSVIQPILFWKEVLISGPLRTFRPKRGSKYANPRRLVPIALYTQFPRLTGREAKW